jgi:transcriptional regulator with XRE-family HTH domain
MKDKYITHEQLIERAKRENPNFDEDIRLGKPAIDVGFQILNLRHCRKMSQEELAKKAGTHQARISKIENAEFDIQISTLAKIAYALDAYLEILISPREDVGATFFTNTSFRGIFTSPVKATAMSDIGTSDYISEVEEVTKEVV